MLIFASLLAFYLAWNLGANDVANSMGTSVGSKAITLRQALVIAGVLEFCGAVLLGQRVSQTLATRIVNLDQFMANPSLLLVGMMAVLIASGIWMNVATAFGLPVSSSHAVVGAIAGFAWIAVGVHAVDWQVISMITLTWVATPIASGAIAALFYSLIQRWILHQPDPSAQFREWVPWLSAILFSVFGVLVLPTLSQPIQSVFYDRLGWVMPSQTLPLGIGGIGAISLAIVSWRWNDPFIEHQFARLQILSACFVAFAHGANDVGNAIAPLAAIAYINQTGTVPMTGFPVPLWILALGGVGIVAGLSIWGKKVIGTISEGITSIQPSGGFCAELATATTILLASQIGLPVSTSHALVGSVVGMGLVQRPQVIQWGTLWSMVMVWLVTIPVSAGLGASIFAIARLLVSLNG